MKFFVSAMPHSGSRCKGLWRFQVKVHCVCCGEPAYYAEELAIPSIGNLSLCEDCLSGALESLRREMKNDPNYAGEEAHQ